VSRWLIGGIAAAGVVALALHLDARVPVAAAFALVAFAGVVLMAPSRDRAVAAEIGRSLVLGVLLGLLGTWLQHDASERADRAEHALRDRAEQAELALMLSRTGDLAGIDLSERDLREFYLAGKNLTNADFTKADLRKANLRRSTLYGAVFKEAKLNGADLGGAHLEPLDSEPAYLVGVDLRNLKAANAKLLEARLRDADLRDAILSGANLAGADLRGADLRGAKLAGTNLRGAIMTHADIRNAHFTADLRDAKLEDAALDDVKYDGTTEFPGPRGHFDLRQHVNDTNDEPDEIPVPPDALKDVVKEVADGDTLMLATGRKATLLGLDAPQDEFRLRECGGPDATRHLKRLLPPETPIRYLVRDTRAKDKFGRLVLYVWSDGEFVNEALLEDGAALARVRGLGGDGFAERYGLNARFHAAAGRAAAKGRGLWEDADCADGIRTEYVAR
jgi:uncharacterized protein YjbI with pentapeptide repeats/endonuclease YncB( thermonuclease family)